VRRLVLDFKHVRYAGSATLGMALAISKAIAKAGGGLVLSHTEFISPLLKLTHAEKLFTIEPDSKSAVARLAAMGV
jgi:anti-anti-sigma regulatory factor